MKAFFRTLPRNTVRLFQGKNLLYHGAAIVLTAIIVLSGFDWWYFVWSSHDIPDMILFPAIVMGAMFPAIIPLLILTAGWIFKDKKMVIVGWAIGQAGVIALIISACYKMLTNRVPPPLGMMLDVSHWFQFGFFESSVFWGWPSSHTTVAFAMSVAFVMLYPKNKILIWVALIYALYIGIGISTSIHWFSEFVAGAIIGTAIGIVVGQSFRGSIQKDLT